MPNSFKVILPNLVYKNNDVFFVFKEKPTKLKKNGKFYYVKELPLHLEKRSYIFKKDNVQYECLILEEEEDDGLIVSVK